MSLNNDNNTIEKPSGKVSVTKYPKQGIGHDAFC